MATLRTKFVHGRAAQLRIGHQAIHADIGEVTVKEIDGRHVKVADEHGDTVWVPAREIN